ncbi:UNVERIFIED_CONTAM: hypothetical protein RMT77_011751 [Armadillidium vulgare]
MRSNLIITNFDSFAKVLEMVHQCYKGYESRLNNIEIEDEAYRISFSCCDLSLSLNKVGLEEPAEEEENLGKSNIEFERVLVINDDEKFDNFFINIDNKVLASQTPLNESSPSVHNCEDDPLMVEENIISENCALLKKNLSENNFQISSKNFFPKVVDWSSDSVETISKVAGKNKIKYPKTLVCEFCGEQFIGKDRVYNFFHHRNKNHIQEVKYTCPICNKVYWGERQLCAHISSHAAKDFMCEVCGTAFQRKNDFNRHKLIHNEKKFNCKYCSKSFTRNDNLKIHERIHTGDCIHLCTKCNNGFPQKNQLKLHMKKCKTAKKSI